MCQYPSRPSAYVQIKEFLKLLLFGFRAMHVTGDCYSGLRVNKVLFLSLVEIILTEPSLHPATK